MSVRSLRSGPGASALACAVILAATGALLLAQVLSGALEPTLAMLTYLLAVWAVAAVWGIFPALLAALLAFGMLMYFFLPPLHRLWVSSTSDWSALVLFVLVAGVQGLQTGRMRERQNLAESRQRETEALVLLAEKLVSETSIADMAAVVAEETAAVTHAARAAVIAVVDGALATLGATQGFDPAADAGVDRFARWSFERGQAVGLPTGVAETRPASSWWPDSVSHDEVVPGAARADIFVPLRAAGTTAAVLYVGPRPDRRSHAPDDVRMAVSIAGLASVYLTRRTLEEEAGQTRALREADLLKSTLVSSVSHELKTPLAAMTATVTGLLESDAVLEPTVVRHDLEGVAEGLERLSASIADLLDVSRLESDAWRPSPEPCEIGDVLGTVLARLDPKDRSRVAVRVDDGLPAIEVDFGQWARMLGNLVDNGLEYSGPEGSVRVVARRGAEGVTILVEDDGPGIPADERDRVFEKFFRGRSAQRHPSGTGLGLTIAAEIVRFHGGNIRVESVMPHGTRLIVTISPAPVQDEAH